MFENLKVVELATVLAGPAVGMFFSELGAEVIKVENSRTKGDVTRSWKLPSEEDGCPVSGYFSSVNWGKKHIFKDLSDPKDHTDVLALIAEADLLIVNFKEGDDVKFGVDYEHMKELNPKLIYAWLRGFESNPNRVAYDVVLQAEAGYMYMNGDADGEATKMPLAMMDVLAAHQLKEAILVALLKRGSTGKGGYVETSLERAAIANLTNQATNWLMGNHIPQRMGSLHPNIAPYGEVFTCSDGKKIVLAVGSDKQFRHLCGTHKNGGSDIAKRYPHNQDRVKNRKHLYNDLIPLFANVERDVILNQLIDLNVPAAAIRDMKEVFEGSVAQSMILEEEIEGYATKRVGTVGFKVRMVGDV